MFCFCKT
jgi:hypothetical protein